MMAPKMEARIMQALDIRKTDRILEVGTGSGYLTALLAHCGQHVYSVEIVPELSRAAAVKLAAHGITNVSLEVGDAARGWDRQGPYDVIAITGSVPVLPDAFGAALKAGGRLFAVVGDAPAMEAQLVTCVTAGAFNVAGLFETCIDPLQNALQPERFEF
jgi:protein-L-isoaspartate(D-aspartate) O-methyltransferase